MDIGASLHVLCDFAVCGGVVFDQGLAFGGSTSPFRALHERMGHPILWCTGILRCAQDEFERLWLTAYRERASWVGYGFGLEGWGDLRLFNEFSTDFIRLSELR